MLPGLNTVRNTPTRRMNTGRLSWLTSFEVNRPACRSEQLMRALYGDIYAGKITERKTIVSVTSVITNEPRQWDDWPAWFFLVVIICNDNITWNMPSFKFSSNRYIVLNLYQNKTTTHHQQTCNSPQRARKNSPQNTPPQWKRMAIHRSSTIPRLAALCHPPPRTTHFVVPSSAWDWSSDGGDWSGVEEDGFGGI